MSLSQFAQAPVVAGVSHADMFVQQNPTSAVSVPSQQPIHLSLDGLPPVAVATSAKVLTDPSPVLGQDITQVTFAQAPVTVPVGGIRHSLTPEQQALYSQVQAAQTPEQQQALLLQQMQQQLQVEVAAAAVAPDAAAASAAAPPPPPPPPLPPRRRFRVKRSRPLVRKDPKVVEAERQARLKYVVWLIMISCITTKDAKVTTITWCKSFRSVLSCFITLRSFSRHVKPCSSTKE